MTIVREDDDGIIPISAVDGEPDLLSRIESNLSAFGASTPTIASPKSTTASAASPPTRRRIEPPDVARRGPVRLPRLKIRPHTNPLATDHQATHLRSRGRGLWLSGRLPQPDSGMFDRLQNQYLGQESPPAKRRSAADRRRGDDSLSTTESRRCRRLRPVRKRSRTDRCLRGPTRHVGTAHPREWATDHQALAAATADQVDAFRQQVDARLSTLEALAAIDAVDMGGGVYPRRSTKTVQDNREEWVDALADLRARA